MPGSVVQVAATVPALGPSCGHALMRSAAGTLIIAEHLSKIHLHEVVPGPKLSLQPIASLPSPEPDSRTQELRVAEAGWAADSSAVVLRYQIVDFSDVRWTGNLDHFIEVKSVYACIKISSNTACQHACF